MPFKILILLLAVNTIKPHHHHLNLNDEGLLGHDKLLIQHVYEDHDLLSQQHKSVMDYILQLNIPPSVYEDRHLKDPRHSQRICQEKHTFLDMEAYLWLLIKHAALD